MTATDVDPVRAFHRALPAYLRSQLNVTDRVVAFIHTAVRERGWTVEQLAEECCRDTQGVYRLGGLITYRLERCSQHAPPGAKPPSRPLCGECDNGLIYHVPDDPEQPVTATKCPCRSGS